MAKRSKKNPLKRVWRNHFRPKPNGDEKSIRTLELEYEAAVSLNIPPTEVEQEFLNIDYNVTSEAIIDSDLQTLTEGDSRLFEKGYGFLFEKPKRAISIFKTLVERYPHIPTFHNNLLVSLRAIKSQAEIAELIIEQYELFPDYLFAKTNYVMWLIEQGRGSEVPKVLSGKYKLSHLYPERTLFHVTEHLNFLGTMAHYFASLGRLSFADEFTDLIEEWDESHPMLDAYDSFVGNNPIVKMEIIKETYRSMGLKLQDEEEIELVDEEDFDEFKTDEVYGQSNPLLLPSEHLIK